MAQPQTTPADVHAMLAAAPIRSERRRANQRCLIGPCLRGKPVAERSGLADDFDTGAVEQVRLMRRNLRTAAASLMTNARTCLISLREHFLRAKPRLIQTPVPGSANRQTS